MRKKKVLDDPSVREKAAALVKDATNAAAGAATSAALTAATGASPGLVAATGAASIAPFFLTTLLNVFSVARAWKERDALKFWNTLLLGSGSEEEVTPEEIAGTVIAHEEEPFVHETLYRSIRTVLDAADPAVTVPLGLLAREYIGTEKKPDAFFRGFAQLLSQLSADDYQGLQHLMRSLKASTLPHEELRVILGSFKEGPGFYIYEAKGEQQGMYFAGASENPGYLLHLLRVSRFAREVTGLFADAGETAYIDRSTAARLCQYFR